MLASVLGWKADVAAVGSQLVVISLHCEWEGRMTDRDQRLTFVILWLFALFNYIYGDIGMIFSLYVEPEQLARLQKGLTSGGHTDLYFLGGAVFMEVSFLAMLLSWVAPHNVARWVNVFAGILFTLAMAVILLAPLGRGRLPPANYYSFCAVVEIITTVAIVWRAWKWRPIQAVAG
jgi:hypothetical protein